MMSEKTVSEYIKNLVNTNMSKHRKAVDNNISRYYNLYIKDLYLSSFYYKGFKFTITGVECTTADTVPSIDYNDEKIIIKQTFDYDWNLELSLSMINKVKLNLNDYKRLMDGTYRQCYVLDEAIEREVVINW